MARSALLGLGETQDLMLPRYFGRDTEPKSVVAVSLGVGGAGVLDTTVLASALPTCKKGELASPAAGGKLVRALK